VRSDGADGGNYNWWFGVVDSIEFTAATGSVIALWQVWQSDWLVALSKLYRQCNIGSGRR
jgi:hypothetical protein